MPSAIAQAACGAGWKGRPMGWAVQLALAVLIGILGIYVLFDPVSMVTLAESVVPWALVATGLVAFATVALRRHGGARRIAGPAILGALLLVIGLVIRFGRGGGNGYAAIPFLFALLLIGSAVAKLVMASAVRRSSYWPFLAGSALLSLVIGVLVLADWVSVGRGLIGVVIGIELLADAVAVGALALRDRDVRIAFLQTRK